MTSGGNDDKTRGWPLAAVRALASPHAWRATFHLMAGMFLGATTAATVWLLAVLCSAAVASLVQGPTGDRLLAVLYVFVAVLVPLVLLPCVRFLSALQRERFRALLAVEIAAPRHDPGTGWLRLLRPWTAGSSWRQLAYHLLAPLLGVLGGAVVVLCWSAPVLAALPDGGRSWPENVGWFGGAVALLLAAPWVARGLAAADTAAARRLLGPDRAEALAARVEALARSRAELADAADAERRRIERDLHDGVQQRLVYLAMRLGMARAALSDAAPQVRDVIAEAHDEATAALAELRDFVRGLHPAVLNDRGLDAALSGVAARAPLPVKLRVEVARRCSPSIEAIAYFAVSEALTNVAKHADASRAEVVARRAGDRLVVTVTDDGRGGASADGAGTGLRGLAQRVAAVDGALTVVSPAGGPTTVTVEIPCE
ncbi:signal transduction histidine kinase [Krasilnikovia cinnamomea]|uniref:histidine kinase n=1 Tax=Krasilnikovia cinnamomea TaxID=349313 RepID=A0A4Q7ZMW6_9ACTN|nr:sensor histidine kinase [Krasilnikovia cinnamomea]RZU52362.1 signal transduction histidine kinase [Krasilnikovia cinnamomea]